MKYLFNLWVDVKEQPFGTIITSHYGVIRWVQGPGSIINYGLPSSTLVGAGDLTAHYLSHFLFSVILIVSGVQWADQKDNDKIILW